MLRGWAALEAKLEVELSVVLVVMAVKRVDWSNSSKEAFRHPDPITGEYQDVSATAAGLPPTGDNVFQVVRLHGLRPVGQAVRNRHGVALRDGKKATDARQDFDDI